MKKLTRAEKNALLETFKGKKIVGAGTINGVPAFKLSDGTTVWIQNIAQEGEMVL